jgi:hypothetical protein
MNIHVTCRNARCDHYGIVDAWSAYQWFRLHRWSDSFDTDVLGHFRCTRCGDRGGRASPTENAVTVTRLFPADDRGWKMLARRLRG